MVWECFKKGCKRLGEKRMDFELESVRPRGRPKKTWSETIEKDCHTQQRFKEDAMGRRKWRNLIKDVV